jgi:succinate dehydrogenase / fumarate reductase cytochrome b subunit
MAAGPAEAQMHPEGWGWCYVDEIVLDLGGRTTPSALHDFLASWLGLALLFAWTFSLFFHLCNGIRHLFWDAGYGFDLQTIYASGWAVVAISIGLTLTAWIISFGTKG